MNSDRDDEEFVEQTRESRATLFTPCDAESATSSDLSGEYAMLKEEHAKLVRLVELNYMSLCAISSELAVFGRNGKWAVYEKSPYGTWRYAQGDGAQQYATLMDAIRAAWELEGK
jgi:hypothetical protein